MRMVKEVLKVAASDYDGTLFRDEKIAEADVQSISAWRAAGHKFGLVSGRDYGMLVPQLVHYGVGFDFVVCNNGGLICDEQGQVLYQSCIPSDILADIAAEELVQRSFHFAFSAADCTYLCHEYDGSWIKREAKEWSFPIVKIEESAIGTLEDIQQFSLGFNTPEESAACANLVNARYGGTVHAFPNRCSLDITTAGTSKEQGLRELLERMHWHGAELYPIGDETNDLPMLQAFDGYTVSTARPAIQAQAAATFGSVGDMLAHFN